MAHILRIGGRWDKPYTIKLLGHEINILDAPPKQIEMVMRRQARQQLDIELLQRLARENGWNADKVRAQYPHGVDWELVRRILKGSVGQLAADEKWAYEILVSGAFWTEEKRWLTGYAAHGSCSACHWEIGDLRHNVHGCSAMAAHLSKHFAMGRLSRQRERIYGDDYEPLHLMGLPPLTTQIAPIELELVEGGMSRSWEGGTYGDGSGFFQEMPECRVATWAIIRRGTASERPTEVQRGNVPGWLSTVPRGEISAYMWHLRNLGPRGEYIGDCAMVVRAAQQGVTRQAVSSKNINADLWRQVDRLQKDIGLIGAAARKTKAHRSRRTAEASAEDPIEQWEGNQWADKMAKELARQAANGMTGYRLITTSRDEAVEPIKRAALAVAWKLNLWPALGLCKAKKTRRRTKKRMEDLNGHILKPRGEGAWECTRCRNWAKGAQGRRLILRKTCKGAIEEQAHPTHQTRQDGGVVWCTRCGSFTTRHVRNLLRPCSGAPGNASQHNVWRRLHSGLAPTTASYLTEDRTLERQPADGPLHVQRRHGDGEDQGTTTAASDLSSRSRARARRTWEHAALGNQEVGYQGIYLRLPRAPHHIADVAPELALCTSRTHKTADLTSSRMTPNSSTVTTSNALAGSTAPNSVVRRRICRKTAAADIHPAAAQPPSTATGSESTTVQHLLCRPSHSDPWTRRIAAATGASWPSSAPCSICESARKTICRGCRQRVCAHCAQLRRVCPSQQICYT